MHNVPPAAAVRIDPGAAAARLTESTGNSIEPDAVFAVYRLGRTAFSAAVVRRVGNGHVVVAERAAAIGGAEFDGMLLAYLSGRHPDAGGRLWSRIDDPADHKLRATLLDEIARAREQLSAQDFTVIKLAAADVKMPLTREELESRIEELIAATADLLEDALAEAGVAREELVGLLMAGGVAQTPLVGLTLRRRFDIAPMLAAPGARVLVKDAPPAVTRELPVVEDEEPVRRRGPARAAVVGAALLVVVAAGAAFGSQLGDGDVPDDGAGAAESAATTEADSAPTSKTASPEATDTPSGDGASASSESPSEEQDEAQVEPTREAQPSDEERPPTESAATGTVPNLVGLSTADARKAVDGAGFDGFDQNGRERGFFELYDDCEVIEQDPAPGSTRPLSATVAVTFSYSGDESECDS